jgi:hypothetical protein
MHDFGRVLRKGLPAVLALLGDQRKYVLEFSQSRLARVHERVTASESGDLGDPRAVVLAVQNDLVIVKALGAIVRRVARVSAASSSRSPDDERLLMPVDED